MIDTLGHHSNVHPYIWKHALQYLAGFCFKNGVYHTQTVGLLT